MTGPDPSNDPGVEAGVVGGGGGSSRHAWTSAFLDRVLRTIPVAQDEPRDREQPVTRGRRKDLEGLVIAAPCLFHEIALHRISTGRAAGAALTDYDARWVINRSRIGASLQPTAL